MEAALGTPLEAATPAEGFRRLVSRQSTDAETTGGSWAGVGEVQHQVHNVEGAGAELGGEEVEPPSSDTEEEEWEQQTGWGRAARGRKQVLDEGREVAPEEAGVEQAGEPGRAKAQEDKAAAESYGKRHMLWKGMAGRSWTELDGAGTNGVCLR